MQQLPLSHMICDMEKHLPKPAEKTCSCSIRAKGTQTRVHEGRQAGKREDGAGDGSTGTQGQVSCWPGDGIALGLGLLAALAPGETGSAQRGAAGVVGFGAGIKGGLFPAVGSCLPGQAVQGMGTLSFGR